MPAPLKYADLSTLLGSWPTIPEFISGIASVDPRAIDSEATILGVSRKDSYDVGGKEIVIAYGLSGGGGGSQAVVFSAGPRTLDEVITDINTAIGQTFATNDNGFLRITNTINGAYLRLDPSSNPEAYYELGLFVGTEAVVGQLTQTQHFDPDRQVAFPGQLSLGDGENFKASAINRALHQLSTNTDYNQAVVGRKRVPLVQETDDLTFLNDAGLDLSSLSAGFVYTGPDSSPNEDQLEGLFKFIDGEGREVLWEDIVEEDVAGVPDLAQDAETFEWHVTTNDVWLSTDPEGNIFVRMNGLSAGSNSDINGVPLKVVSYISGTEVVIDPADYSLTDENAGTVSRVSVTYKKLRVKQVQKSDIDATRVEKLEESMVSAEPVTRVDKGNRIVCSGATFSETVEGDWYGYKVTWTGHTDAEPFDNNGSYRISRVLDENTIEVVGDDFGPVVLNPDDGTSFGSIDITSDGNFWKNPYLKFVDGAEVTGKTFRLRYYKAGTLEEATDDPYNLIGNNLDYGIKADLSIQKAILAILGPSVSSINEYVYDDHRITLEDLNNRLVDEHYDHDTVGPDGKSGHGGRHQDIRPDTIDLFPYVSGVTLKVRTVAAEETILPGGGGPTKIALLDSSGGEHFYVRADGGVVSQAYPTGHVYDDLAAILYTTKIPEYSARLRLQGVGTGHVVAVDLVANATAANPNHYSIHADDSTENLHVDVENNGNGSSYGIFTVAKTGLVIFHQYTHFEQQVTFKRTSSGTYVVGDESGSPAWSIYTASAGTVIGLKSQTASGTAQVEGNSPTFSGPGGSAGAIAGNASVGGVGGAAFLTAGNAAGTDYAGGDATVSGGDGTGDQGSNVILKAAVAGASGATARVAEEFLKCSSTGIVVISKPVSMIDDINMNSNDIYGADIFSGNAIILSPYSGPSSVTGTLYFNNPRNKLWGFNGDHWDRYIPQSFAMGTEEEHTYSTSQSYTSAVHTIDGNTLSVGSTVRIRAAGYISTNGTNNTLSLTLREGAGPTSDSISFTPTAGGYFYIDAIATVWDAAASGARFRFLGMMVAGSSGGGAGAAHADGTSASAPTMDTTGEIAVLFETFATGSSTTKLSEFVVDVT